MQEAALSNMGEIYTSIELQTISTHFIHRYQFSVCLVSRKSLNALSTATDDIEAIMDDDRSRVSAPLRRNNAIVENVVAADALVEIIGQGRVRH